MPQHPEWTQHSHRGVLRAAPGPLTPRNIARQRVYRPGVVQVKAGGVELVLVATLAACGFNPKQAPASPASASAVVPRPLPLCAVPAHEAVVGASTDAPANDHGGAIQGVVRDLSTQGPLPDVTVVAASPALGSASLLTDARGQYQFTNLPPGTYLVAFYYGELQVQQSNVTVAIGRVTPVNIRLDQTAPAGTVVDIAQRAPTIDGDFGPGPRDPNDPRGGHLWPGMPTTIGQDYSRNLPAARPTCLSSKR